MTKRIINHTLITLVSAVALACGGNEGPSSQDTVPSEAATAPNNSWVTVHGRIVEATPSSFVMDYGEGVITVEMDDFDFYPDGYGLMEEDRVVVHGFIDDDFFEARTIEASRVYVENLGTSFYANGADEEDVTTAAVVLPDPGTITVTGRIKTIEGRELTLDTGVGDVRVDTIEMGYDPTDDEGYQQLSTGDKVSVAGHLEDALFDSLELHADSIVTLESST